jgi:hypothetical protein
MPKKETYMSQNPPQGSEGEGQGRLPCPYGDALKFFPKITESIAITTSRQGPPFICGKALSKVSLSRIENYRCTKVLIYGIPGINFFLTGEIDLVSGLWEGYLDS